MTQMEQTILLFAGIVVVLVFASAVGFLLARRQGPAPDAIVENLNQRIKAWWVMVALIGLAFLFGRTGVLVLFAFASFTALREFITLTETRRGDHYALVAAFFVILPIQYWLIAVAENEDRRDFLSRAHAALLALDPSTSRRSSR